MARFNDRQSILDMCMAGKSNPECAKHFGVSVSLVKNILREFGYKRPVKFIDDALICSLYASGVSENAISKQMGITRRRVGTAVINSILATRTRSECETLKWSRMSADERANQVSAAHQSIRDKPPEFHHASAIKQAISKADSLSKVGKFESEFIAAFNARGLDCIPQRQVWRYNIDIAINNTAVEIHCCPNFPHNHTYYSNRIVKLLELGWNVIYIKIDRLEPLIDITADKVCRMIDIAESNKSGVGQYGMISGSGKLVTSGCLDGDKLACVSAADGFFAACE